MNPTVETRMPEEYRPMQVGQILDKTTVVVIGPGIVDVRPGEALQILAVGREVPGVGAPLIIPKATIKVGNITSAYVIARTTTYEAEVSSNPFELLGPTTRKVTRHYELTVDESKMIGNPASTPVTVGDPVIKLNDLARFISQFTHSGGTTEKT
jgi:hypothetical protein